MRLRLSALKEVACRIARDTHSREDGAANSDSCTLPPHQTHSDSVRYRLKALI